MKELVLREFQAVGFETVRERIRARRRRLLVQSPTGSGKSVVIAHTASSAVPRGKRILILAHREELIDQLSAKLDARGVDHGVIQAGNPRRRPWLPVQVASVPTLIRRLDELPPADLVLVDEAHHSASASFRRLLSAYPDAYVIGFTATPERYDGSGLDDLYEEIVVLSTIPELITMGYLVPPIVFDPKGRVSAKGVAKSGGDYNKAQLGALMGKPEVIGNVVSHWLKWAHGRTTVLFAPNIETSRSVVQRFNANGIRAVHVDADTPKGERRDNLKRVASGEITIVANVGLLTEGWDLPRVSCVQVMRHTMSLAMHYQIIGRGLRTYCDSCDGTDLTCEAPNHKHDCFVLDHVGNCEAHGQVTWPRTFSLKGRAKDPSGGGRREGVPRTWRCPKCPVINLLTEMSCIHCGAAQPVSSKVILEKPGELKRASDEWRERIPEDTRHKVLAKFILDGIQRSYDPTRASVIYRKMFHQPPTPEVAAKARAIVEARLAEEKARAAAA